MDQEVIVLHFDLSPWDEDVRKQGILKIFTALSFKGLETTIESTRSSSNKDQGILFRICRREYQSVWDMLAEEFEYAGEDSAVRSAEVG